MLLGRQARRNSNVKNRTLERHKGAASSLTFALRFSAMRNSSNLFATRRAHTVNRQRKVEARLEKATKKLESQKTAAGAAVEGVAEAAGRASEQKKNPCTSRAESGCQN